MRAAGENILQIFTQYLFRDFTLGNRGIHCGKPLADRLYHERHHKEDLRLHDADISHHVKQRVIDVKSRAAGKALQPVHDQAVGMVDGQDGEHRRSRLKGNNNIGHVVIEIPLRQHDAFRLAGRAGCENDGGYVIRLGAPVVGEGFPGLICNKFRK